ncbi:MAG: MlaD family protein [Chthoniobacterales bacterium]
MNSHKEYGQVIRHAPLQLSWVWLFPLLAVSAAAWFFWTDWKSNGPQIQIQFHEAPGIEANKTLLFYRGVVAGKVTDVRLDKNLSEAIVTVRLKSFATALSQSGTIYWIDQPVIGLAKTSGLSSIIQGNSLQARLGEGAKTDRFVGMARMPLHPLEPPGLILKLTAKNLPALEEGTPITYRGITIGGIMSEGIDHNGDPYAVVAIQQQYVNVIRTNSRFWNVAVSSLQIGPSGINFELLNLKGIFLGAVAVDCFEQPGDVVQSGAEFELCASERAARAEDDGMSFRVDAKEIETIDVGAPIFYHGIIVGSVKKKELNQNNKPSLTLLIKKEFVGRVHQNSKFWRVPATSIQAGPGVMKVTIAGVKSLFEGGIAFDDFGNGGSTATDGSTFQLFANEQVAHLGSRPLILSFDDGQGLLPDQTQVRYLGIPVGLVKEVKAARGHIEVIAFLDPAYDFLRHSGVIYSIVRPKIALRGVSGLETLVSGVYIECKPAPTIQRPVKNFFKTIFDGGKK